MNFANRGRPPFPQRLGEFPAPKRCGFCRGIVAMAGNYYEGFRSVNENLRTSTDFLLWRVAGAPAAQSGSRASLVIVNWVSAPAGFGNPVRATGWPHRSKPLRFRERYDASLPHRRFPDRGREARFHGLLLSAIKVHTRETPQSAQGRSVNAGMG